MMSSTQRSAWTPKTYQPDNEKMFLERMALIKKWFAAWNSTQRWTLVEYLLQRLTDPHLIKIYNLLAPLMPPDLPPPQDFTRVLPRALSLRIFSYLDPKSLSRAAQVCWYWKYLCDSSALWRAKCLRQGWFLPRPPLTEPASSSLWKTHYISCVSQLHWTPATELTGDHPSLTHLHGNPNSLSPPSPSHLPPSSSLSPPHHTSRAEHHAPWRDPDPHPDDLSRHTVYMTSQQPTEDYAFLKVSAKCSLRSRKRHITHPVFHSRTTAPQPTQRSPTPHPTHTTTTDQTSPLQTKMHPTLLEKLRIGSPTPQYMRLSVSDGRSGRRRNEVCDNIQNESPFPKLPAYYTVSPGNKGGVEGGNEGWRSEGAGGCGLKSSVTDSTDCERRDHVTSHVTQLPSQPWHIPEYSEDEGDTTTRQ